MLNHFLFAESLFYFDEHGYYRLFVKKHKAITHQFLLVGIGERLSHGTQPFLDNIIYQDSIYQVCFSNLVLTYDGWFQGKFVWQNQSIHINMVIKVPSQILIKKLYPLLNDVLNH